MKNIILHLDKTLFLRMKADKAKWQIKLGYCITWEKYIEMLFGFSRRKR